MPGETSGRPPSHVDFAAFCDARYDELRRAFAGANYLGLKPEDVLHDTMMLARRHHRRFATDDELFAWCITVGVRKMRKQAAHLANRKREDPHPSPDTLAPASLSNVEDLAVARDEVNRLMAMLPPKYAEVIRLAAEGNDRSEMAALLGTTPAAVGMLLYRARRAARNCWEKLIAAAAVVIGGARRLHRATPTLQAQALVLSMTVAASLVLPAPGVSGRAIASPSSRRAATTTHIPTAKPSASVPASGATVKRSASPPQTAGYQHPASKQATPGLAQPMPRTCAPHVCVNASCPSDKQAGDKIYLNAVNGPCGVGVVEGVTPACEYVASNPALGCQRAGHPQWLVPPPPSPSPKGEPL